MNVYYYNINLFTRIVMTVEARLSEPHTSGTALQDACVHICVNDGFGICTGAKVQMLKVSLSQLCSCFDLLLSGYFNSLQWPNN